MTPATPEGELRQALRALNPFFHKALVFSLLSALMVLAPTFYMWEVFGRVVNSRNMTTLVMLTLAVLFAYMIMEALAWARNELLREAGQTLDRLLSHRVFETLFRLNLRRQAPPSSHPMQDLRTLRDFLASGPVSTVMESPVALIFLGMLFWIHPVLGWSALAGAAAQVVLAGLIERTTYPLLIEANRQSLAAQQYADKSLQSAQVIEAMGFLRNIQRRWLDKQTTFLRLQALASDRAGAFSAMTRFLQVAISSGLLGLGAWLVLQNQLPGGAGMMIVGKILGGLVLSPLVRLITQWRLVVQARDAWQRLDTLLRAAPAAEPAMPLPPPTGQLSVENLVAAPPGSPVPILRGLNFSLTPGELLVVVGPSASGKTTLARMLMGLWPAYNGKVRLDGVDLHTWQKEELGPHVGYLPQGVELLEGTIGENIARFGEVDLTAVQAAARLAGMDGLIEALPEGYESVVGADGNRFSGGQRQRLGLARALYRDPAFVVLDEPNASLDEAGEACLMEALKSLKARKATTVVISHRTSVLAVADKVLVLRDGTQQMFGPRQEVLTALARASQAAAQPRPGPSLATP